MTAGEVAEKSGLARAAVSSTLSRLARSGEVQKAERGYRLVPAGSPIEPATSTVTDAPAGESSDTAASETAETAGASRSEAAVGETPNTPRARHARHHRWRLTPTLRSRARSGSSPDAAAGPPMPGTVPGTRRASADPNAAGRSGHQPNQVEGPAYSRGLRSLAWRPLASGGAPCLGGCSSIPAEARINSASRKCPAIAA